MNSKRPIKFLGLSVFVSLSSLLLLFMLSTIVLLLPIRSAFADSYDDGSDEGCFDARRDLQGLNGHGYDESVNHGDSEFRRGYVDGYRDCWNEGGHQPSQETYDDEPPTNNGGDTILTVTVPHHPFGKSAVNIYITAQNGYKDHAYVSTATTGYPSWTFTIPENQGNSVYVCVDSGFLSQSNCQTYLINGGYMTVSLPAPG
jgi:hypothetical protein